MAKLSGFAKWLRRLTIILAGLLIIATLAMMIVKIVHGLWAGASWTIIYGNLAQIFAAILTFAAIATALFKETFIRWIYHPDLRISVKNGPPDCHKSPVDKKSLIKTEKGLTEIIQKTEGYYFRLWVKNEGAIRAEKVQVYVANLRRIEGKESKELSNFLPMNLKWAHTDEIFADGISPKMGKHCDIGSIINPAGRIETLTDVPEDETIFELRLEVAPYTKGHVLPAGCYELDLKIAAANCKPIEKTLVINLTGEWHDEEEKMFSNGMKLKVLK